MVLWDVLPKYASVAIDAARACNLGQSKTCVDKPVYDLFVLPARIVFCIVICGRFWVRDCERFRLRLQLV